MEIIQEENNFYKDRSDMFNLKGLLDIEDFSHKNFCPDCGAKMKVKEYWE